MWGEGDGRKAGRMSDTVELARAVHDAAIFDLDGVLADTTGAHFSAWKAVFDPLLAQRGDGQRHADLQLHPRRSIDGGDAQQRVVRQRDVQLRRQRQPDAGQPRHHDGQPPDQRLPPDHPLDADGERDGDHRWQRLGNDGHRQRDAEDDHLEQRQSPPDTQGDDRQARPRTRQGRWLEQFTLTFFQLNHEARRRFLPRLARPVPTSRWHGVRSCARERRA